MTVSTMISQLQSQRHMELAKKNKPQKGYHIKFTDLNQY